MALLNGLGQAATIAQLSGLDAFGLTSMIMKAVHTVRRNKKACKQLEQRVQMIADLLQSIEVSETRRPLNGLEHTLRCAYILVTSCQNSRNIYLFFYGEKLANKFSEVQNSIDFYLQVFPVLSHIDTTRLLVRILNGVHPPQNEVIFLVSCLFEYLSKKRISAPFSLAVDETERMYLHEDRLSIHM